MDQDYFAFTTHLLLFLLVCADSAHSQVHYYIRSSESLNVHCPGDPCLTLAQFAANSTSYLGYETNIYLSFLPGNHSLDRELHLSHADNFSMTKDIGGNGTVFVECGSQSGRFNISEITMATIMGLHFIGCGGNRVSQMEQFIVEDTIFQGVEGRGTALVLNEVTSASIARSSFLSNTYGIRSTFELHDISPYPNAQDIVNYILDYQNQNSSLAVGGALSTVFSSVSVVSSTFIDNAAEIGGVLFACNSSLYVVGSTYSYNRASFGGVMITSESSVNIDNSTFSENAAEITGGVMVTYRDSFSIKGITFVNNTAEGDYGGVMHTYNSIFSIINSTFSDNSGGSGPVLAEYSSFSIRRSTFTNNSAGWGAAILSIATSMDISNSIFICNSANHNGGAIYAWHSSFSITRSTFSNSTAGHDSGVIHASDCILFNITNCTFINNSAANDGGVIRTWSTIFNIANSSFANNSAVRGGGVMLAFQNATIKITGSTFNNNTMAALGGAIASTATSVDISNSTFICNSANHNGGAIYAWHSSFSITRSTFSNNTAGHDSGVIHASDCILFNITKCTFTNNSAAEHGGVIRTWSTVFSIVNSTFTNNSAVRYGGVMFTFDNAAINITSSTFTNNKKANYGGVMYSHKATYNITNSTFTYNSARRGGIGFAISSSVNIVDSTVHANKADTNGGIMFITQGFIHITDGIFDHNSGSLYIFSSNLTFSGYTRFENCEEPSNKLDTDPITSLHQEGGAITSVQSTAIFTGVTSLSNNQARHGGAILATESKIVMYSEAIIANNTATISNGGGISLHQSDLEIKGNCIFSGNNAVRGGGIHATSSTVAVYQPGTLKVNNNRAENGGGLYLEVNAKLYVLKDESRENSDEEYLLIFGDNHANYGGAVYMADNTNPGACSLDNECFIQTLALHQRTFDWLSTKNILFSGNTASGQGANLFGGLLDRCIPSPFAEVYRFTIPTFHSAVSYLGEISNITGLDTVSSQPVRVCFCKSDSESEPDCSYQPPTVKVKKGEAFTVPLVAVDQVNHSVGANIISSLSSQNGGFSEGQQTQSVGKTCSNITFNIFSPHGSETINLFADGPCGSATLSTRHLVIQFTGCTCPVGFQPLVSETRCECLCDSELSPYITNCDPITESLVRMNTNSWITHINDTGLPGYIIHPNCPFDYCQSPTENVSMNLNLPNGADAQCAYDRSGVLCGTCQKHLSLSLGSSRCLPCHSHWPAVFIIILLAAIIAGILLVTTLLALNMTVAVGLINGFIFYANIVSANSAIFFPSSEPSFPTVFVAWLNLDVGIDVCFFDGLDAYIKTWLQLAFPVYIISLVIIIFIVSEYSPRFAGLIGKRDPIATLATLILLSYTKLLSVTITALSFAVLDYPDGSQETIWLPNGNMRYSQQNHIALVLVALLIILIGVPYTILLFLWQWLTRAPNWKVFKWTRNTKLNAFVSAHHVPYNSKYRYWTGLLLFVRVVLYVTASVTVSDKPQTSLLITIFLVGGLSLIKEITGARVYKKSLLNIIETGLNFNLLALSAFNWYDFKTDIKKQTAIAYTSTIITFILLVGVIIYHVYLLVRKDQPPEEVNEYPLAPVQEPDNTELTHSIIVIPNPRDQSPLPEANCDEIMVKEKQKWLYT